MERPGDQSAAPAVSVLMPVFDAERYLATAIESVLAQSFADFELLLFDDGSSDRSAEIATAFAARDPRVRAVRGPHRGLVAWLVQGVEEARGTYLARMDADDVARPERFARQVSWLRHHPECVALGTEALLVDPDGRAIRRLGIRTDHAGIEAELLTRRGDALLHPTAMMRRSAVLRVGSYRPDTETAEDLDLFLRLAEFGRLANLSDTLLDYRQHLATVSGTRAGEQRRTQNAVLREAFARRGLPVRFPPDDPRETFARGPVESRRRWTRDAIAGRHLATARRHATAVWHAEPWSWRSLDLLLCAALGIEFGPPRRAVRWLRAKIAARSGAPIGVSR